MSLYKTYVQELCIAVFLILLLSLFVGGASAQSGTPITVTGSFTKTYGTAAANSGTTLLPGSIWFDYSDYNSVSQITMSTIAVFAHDSETTTFSCSSNCVGSGTFTYSNSSHTLTWYFNSGFTVSGSPFALNYNNQYILTNISSLSYSGTTPCSVSANQPVIIQFTGNTCSWTTTNAFSVIVSSSVTNSYTVTYSGSGLATVSVDKSGSTVATEFHVHDALGVDYANETFFNTQNSFNPTFIYANQLWINLTTNYGAFNNVLINSTVVFLAPPVADTIQFNYIPPVYVGSHYGIGWNISSFSNLNSYYAIVSNPDGKCAGGKIPLPAKVGTTGLVYVFAAINLLHPDQPSPCQVAGYWNVSMYSDSVLDIGGWFPTFINSQQLLVLPASSLSSGFLLSVDKTSYYPGQYIQVTATNPSTAMVYLSTFGDFLPGVPIISMDYNVMIPPGAVVNYSLLIPAGMFSGNYTEIMAGTNSYVPVLNSTNFTITLPPKGSGNYGLQWAELYNLGDTGVLKYVTDHNASTIYLYYNDGQGGGNYNRGTWSVQGDQANVVTVTFDKVGNYNAYLVDNSNAANNTWANTTIWPSNSPIQYPGAGGPPKLADYINWNNSTYSPGSPYQLKYQVTPYDNLNWIYLLRIYDPNKNLIKQKVILNTSLPFSNPYRGYYVDMFSNYDVQGTWMAQIVKQNMTDYLMPNSTSGDTSISVATGFAILSGGAGSGGSGGGSSGGGTSSGVGTATNNFLWTMITQPILWGIIIWVLVVYYVASKPGDNSKAVEIVAVVAALLESAAGLFQPFTWYIVGGLVIVLSARFYGLRKAQTGDEE